MIYLSKWEETRILVKVSQMYYIDGLTQNQISNKLGIYRTTISRLLKKAKEEGIVNITIKSEFNGCFQLEEAMEKRFGLKETCIVPSETMQTHDIKSQILGFAAAEYLKRIAKDGDIIGFSWGTTLASLSRALTDCKAISANIVPLVGGFSDIDSENHVSAIVSKVALAFKVKAHYLYAPAITSDKAIKAAVIQDDNYKNISQLWKKVNKAFVGIGSRHKSSNLVWSNEYKSKDTTDIKNSKAVGEICSRFYDVKGDIIDSDINDRTIGIELDMLRNLEYSIGVAESQEKVPSILSALKGKFINVLITTEETARLILELDDQIKRVEYEK
ncbi:sugar-binding transcriptional regulator [Clostridium akagii]|uniref:sugar-binding transcriptional regulator n=1 Tax=Clostridium akagii TaxID=91623 RepID=UPI001FA7BDCE|nr:sugar-binding transcriptional regulator [Clostridium akagii]